MQTNGPEICPITPNWNAFEPIKQPSTVTHRYAFPNVCVYHIGADLSANQIVYNISHMPPHKGKWKIKIQTSLHWFRKAKSRRRAITKHQCVYARLKFNMQTCTWAQVQSRFTISLCMYVWVVFFVWNEDNLCISSSFN